MMFPDSGSFAARVAAIIGGKAALSFSDAGEIRHRRWRIADSAEIAAFAESLEGATAYIADGHHRYATALRYRDEVGADGAWTLGYFTPMGAPGLVVLPYHRILASGPRLAEARAALEGPFAVREIRDVATAASAVAVSEAPYAFALVEPGGRGILVESLLGALALIDSAAAPSLRALDTWFLHQVVLPRLKVSEDAVSYVHSLREAEDAVADGNCRLAVLLRPTPARQIVDVADAHESMPAKSTFFYPKLPSGLVIHPLLA
jgi:uncharacterized protein (DUF1015 family)